MIVAKRLEGVFDQVPGPLASQSLNDAKNLWINPEDVRVQSRPPMIRPTIGYLPVAGGPTNTLYALGDMTPGRRFDNILNTQVSATDPSTVNTFSNKVILSGVYDVPSGSGLSQIMTLRFDAVTKNPPFNALFLATAGTAAVSLQQNGNTLAAAPRRPVQTDLTTFAYLPWQTGDFTYSVSQATNYGGGLQPTGFQKLYGMAFCQGRNFVLGTRSTGEASVTWSDVGQPTVFQFGNFLDLRGAATQTSLNSYVGLVTYKNRFILVFGENGVLVYEVTTDAIPLKLVSSAAGVGSLIPGFVFTAGEAVICLGPDGLTTLSQEAFKNDVTAKPLIPEVNDFMISWYKQAKEMSASLTAFTSNSGSMLSRGYGIYVQHLNCLLFLNMGTSQILYVWLGSPSRPPFASIWTTMSGIYYMQVVEHPGLAPTVLFVRQTVTGNPRQEFWLLRVPALSRQIDAEIGQAAIISNETPYAANWYTPRLSLNADGEYKATELTEVTLGVKAYRYNPASVAIPEVAYAGRDGGGPYPDGYLASQTDLSSVLLSRPEAFRLYTEFNQESRPVRLPYCPAASDSLRLQVYLGNAHEVAMSLPHLDIAFKATKERKSSREK